MSLKTYIFLFRGINVGGSHRLPMTDLRQLLERSGCTEVRTYIQSGNAICRSGETNMDRLARQVTAAVSRSHGFEPRVLVLTLAELKKAAANNPFPQAVQFPQSLHLFFLAERPPRPDLKALEALKTPTERFKLEGKTFYVHTPDGFGKSKLAERTERLLGVEATARNWRTVTTLIEMADGG